jgi:hypothetical protein
MGVVGIMIQRSVANLVAEKDHFAPGRGDKVPRRDDFLSDGTEVRVGIAVASYFQGDRS